MDRHRLIDIVSREKMKESSIRPFCQKGVENYEEVYGGRSMSKMPWKDIQDAKQDIWVCRC